MAYEYFKSLHIIFVITWFAGLFYLPRLFIYFIEANDKSETEKIILQNQFSIMQKRLWFGITWPSCILSIVFGLSMLHHWFPLNENPWLMVKLALVFLLFLYHLSLGHIRKKLESGNCQYTSTQMRFWNEVSTLFVISIVFLVVAKNILSMTYGLLGLVVLIITLSMAILYYKRRRLKV